MAKEVKIELYLRSVTVYVKEHWRQEIWVLKLGCATWSQPLCNEYSGLDDLNTFFPVLSAVGLQHFTVRI